MESTTFALAAARWNAARWNAARWNAARWNAARWNAAPTFTQWLPSADRYKEVRRWYARDHGRTTLDEVVTMMKRGVATARD